MKSVSPNFAGSMLAGGRAVHDLRRDAPGDLRAATVLGGEWRLMLTSWDALLDLMERVVSGAGDGVAGANIGQLRRLADRMDTNA